MTVVPPSMLALYKRIFKRKYYAHLDAKRSPEQMIRKIKNPQWVAKHGFLPFIHVVLITKKRKGRHIKPEWKERDVYYASHLDRYVFQWYAHLVVEAYEKYIKGNNFDESPIAYRQGLEKNNVHFAAEVFRFIQNKNDCFVYISDFSDFFNTLSHKLLKEKLKTTFGVQELPADHYHIFKTMTKFRYFDIDDIATVTRRSAKELRGRKTKPDQLIDSASMRQIKQEYLKSNKYEDPYTKDKHGVGIPQGSPMSSVYANVYMIDFDKRMSEFVNSVSGLYRRYSDDLICIVPPEHKEEFLLLMNTCVLEARVKVSEKKTKYYFVKDGIPYKMFNSDDGNMLIKTPIEYLGMAFDGSSIKLKSGTLNKYYNKLNRRLHLMKQLSTDFGKLVGKKNIYKRLSHLGEANRLHQKNLRGSEPPMKERNFFTYAYTACEITGDPEIRRQLKGHMKRISRFYNLIEKDIKPNNSGGLE